MKDRSRNVAKAGIGYTIGNILIRGLSFITLPIFTRLMSTADYGLYTTYVSYVSIITLIIGLGLHASTKIAKIEFKEKLDQYISTILLLPILLTGVLLILLLPLQNLVRTLLGYNAFIVMLMILQAWAVSVITMYNNRLSLDYEYKKYLLVAVITSVGNIVLSLILMRTILNNKLFLGRAIGASVPVILVAVFLVIYMFYRAKPQKNRKYVKFGLGYSLPLVPHGLSQVVLAQFGKIVVQREIGNEAAGIYGLTYAIALIPQIFVTSLDTVFGPWFFEKFEKGDVANIKKRTTQYIALFSLITGIIFCISPEIIKLMANQSYWDAIMIVCPAVLGVYLTFLYTIPALIEYYYKKTKYIAAGTIVAAIVNLIACLVLVPRFGYQAAVYITVGTYVLYFLIHMVIASVIAKDKFPFSRKSLLLYPIAVIGFCFLVQTSLSTWLIRYILMVIWCIALGCFNRNAIKDVLLTRLKQRKMVK